MAARRGPSLVGRSVVDAEGVELGYVSSEEETFLTIGEGPVGRLRLGQVREVVVRPGEKIAVDGIAHRLGRHTARRRQARQ